MKKTPTNPIPDRLFKLSGSRRLIHLSAPSLSKTGWLALASAVLFGLSCGAFVGAGSGAGLLAPGGLFFLLALIGSFGFFANCVGKGTGPDKITFPGGSGSDGEYPYTCRNGTPVSGMTQTENTENCEACNTSFVKADDRCVLPSSLDAFVANNGEINRVYINNSRGRFPAIAVQPLSETNDSRGNRLRRFRRRRRP